MLSTLSPMSASTSATWPGRHAEELLDAGLVQELLPPGVKDADPRADELQHVLVRGHDDDVEALRRGFLRERPDDVVGLVARQLQDRDPVGLEDAADVGNLRGEVVGHRDAVGLVLRVGCRGGGSVSGPSQATAR